MKNKKKFIAIVAAIAIVFGSAAIYLDHRDKTKYDNEVIHVTDDDEDESQSTNSGQDRPSIDSSENSDTNINLTKPDINVFDDLIDNPLLKTPNPIRYLNPNDIEELIEDLIDDVEDAVNNRDNSNDSNDDSSESSDDSNNTNDNDEGRNGQTNGGVTPEDPFQTPDDLINDNDNFSVNSISTANVNVSMTLLDGNSSSSISKVVKIAPSKQYINLKTNDDIVETYLIKEGGSVTKYTNELGYWTYTRNSSLNNNFKTMFADGITNDMVLSKSGNIYKITQPLSSINNSILIDLSNTLGSSIKSFNGNIVYEFDNKGNLLKASISNAKSGNKSISATINYSNLNNVKDSEINIPNDTKSGAIDSNDTGNVNTNSIINIQIDGTRLNLFGVISLPSNWKKDASYSSSNLSIYYDTNNNPLYVYLNNSKVTGVNFRRASNNTAPNISINNVSINSTKSTMFSVFGEIEPYSTLEGEYETYKYTITEDNHTYNFEIIVTLNDDKIAEISLSAT